MAVCGLVVSWMVWMNGAIRTTISGDGAVVGVCPPAAVGVAGAGGAAHLPGVLAAVTTLPVIGVPINASPLSGLDALLSIVQMPGGIPLAQLLAGGGNTTTGGIPGPLENETRVAGGALPEDTLPGEDVLPDDPAVG